MPNATPIQEEEPTHLLGQLLFSCQARVLDASKAQRTAALRSSWILHQVDPNAPRTNAPPRTRKAILKAALTHRSADEGPTPVGAIAALLSKKSVRLADRQAGNEADDTCASQNEDKRSSPALFARAFRRVVWV